MSSMLTPCIKVCVIDPRSGLCIGCARSLAEIGRWASFTDSERKALMFELKDRKKRLLADLPPEEALD